MENNKKNDTANQEGFFDKVKNALIKFFKGTKNFFVKTGRVNSDKCYGIIDNIGDFIVYDDHALISAVGMDDVVFTKENVLSYSFEGLGKIRRNKATVKYQITLDDNVVFPEKVREKNDVKNLTAVIFVAKDRAHFLGNGGIEYAEGKSGYIPLDDCEVYGYETCFVIAVKLKKQVGDKVENYQESLLYPYSSVTYIEEKENGKFTVQFEGNKLMSFTPKNDDAYKSMKELEASK